MEAKRVDLEKLEKDLVTVDPAKARSETIRKFLKGVRDLKLRKSRLVCMYGAELLRSSTARKTMAQEELWLCFEQVAIAACDAKSLPLARSAVKELEIQFPDSHRAQRCRGMLLEAEGKYMEADDLYKQLLKDQPANQMVLKRRVGLARSRGNIGEAIELLNEYLGNYMADTDAWDELSKMYIDLGMYKQAAFCVEEMLLAEPNVYSHHLALADILCTIGGIDNLRTARKYYSAAIEYSGGKNLKALYGMCHCIGAITSLRGPKPTEEEMELPLMSAKMLIKLYKENQPDKLGLVRELLDAWGVLDD